jgi:hypothetical protein
MISIRSHTTAMPAVWGTATMLSTHSCAGEGGGRLTLDAPTAMITFCP